ncbi:hypothetical protein [Amaricoccus tamworthensis]|uniref:hypothetical protein n=1 Tax=Amaricoccus tamworthensis TaxID=57002 RepID=UPI003C7DC76D
MKIASPIAALGLAAGLAVAAPVTAVNAQATNACADREMVIKRLADKYGETLQSLGLHQNNAVLEVYASDKSGSWTILISRPNGMACLVASGQMWEAKANPLTPTGNPA